MPEEIYEKLREQLDHYSVGFPHTESGIEKRILKKLFTAEEAEMFLLLSMIPETPESVAERIGRDSGTVTALFEQMLKKGLIFCLRKDGTAKFGALPFAPGILEQQSETMDIELAELFEGYFQEAFHKSYTETSPVLIHRPIPINRVIDVSYPMAIYENSREIVRTQGLIAVAKCICRVQKGALDKGCDRPVETCLMFGSQAQYYIDRGTGRHITTDEALKILDQCEEAGLVTQPFNAQTPANICNCCPDCCVVLGTLKQHPRPVEMVKPSFYALVDSDQCESCETCLERCPMDAITIDGDDPANINLNRCIGCGLCVSTCPTEALSLDPRPEDQRFEPPETGPQTFMEIARRRGKSLIPLAMSK
ncbi:MAG: 4Fe-4S dicluster domain-containing protein [Deltaproteobacteria bacterium]|nr:4Fe-4S dicluster domain-containing protein [Deltaproteobacteria bacterium]